MNNQTQKLEIENVFSQIRSNDYVYEGIENRMFSFDKINFITLNSSTIYVSKCDIVFHKYFLDIMIDFANIEIRYDNIKCFLINSKEDFDVF